jgi:hypothetical protein
MVAISDESEGIIVYNIKTPYKLEDIQGVDLRDVELFGENPLLVYDQESKTFKVIDAANISSGIYGPSLDEPPTEFRGQWWIKEEE